MDSHLTLNFVEDVYDSDSSDSAVKSYDPREYRKQLGKGMYPLFRNLKKLAGVGYWLWNRVLGGV